MKMNVNPEDIVENLKAMGYVANHFAREAEGDQRAANAVYIDAGTNKVKAYMDLTGETPAFKVWADYEEGHRPGRTGEPLHGAALVRFNIQERERVRADLTPAALAAFTVAADGGDLNALQRGFGLEPPHDRYKPRAPKEEAGTATERFVGPVQKSAPGM